MGKTSFVLLCFSLSLLTSLSNAASPPKVLTIDGNALQTSSSYYMRPVFRGRGGGVTRSNPVGHKACLIDGIIQDSSELSPGLPIKFSPVNMTKPGLVRESTDLNIKFLDASPCGISSVWKLGYYDESKKTYFLTNDGVEGNPGSQTLSSWFKIVKANDKDYKLLYCPTVCDFCKVICSDVGVYVEEQNGRRRLALSLTDEIQPFPIFFSKA